MSSRPTSPAGGLRCALIVAVVALVSLAGPALAHAAPVAPGWSITVVANPTSFSASNPAGANNYQVVVTDIGAAATSGKFTVSDALPAGLTLDSAGISSSDDHGRSFTCRGTTAITCSDSSSLSPGESAEIIVPVDVGTSAPATVSDSASVTGGGASSTASASVTSATTGGTPPFGVMAFDGAVSATDGSGQTQAASHPYSASATFQLPEIYDSAAANLLPADSVKDVDVNLPAGFIGDPQATPALCTLDELQTPDPSAPDIPSCPADTQVGVVTVGLQLSDQYDQTLLTQPLYNVVPAAGEPARFGFLVAHQVVLADASVRTGGDYGISVDVPDISQGLGVLSTTLTLWGVPADPSHDAQRGNFCELTTQYGFCLYSGEPSDANPEPFLTNPTDCAAGPLTTTLSADDWEDPGNFQTASFVSHLPDGTQTGVTNCGVVPFDPSLTATPTTATANEPSGMSVDLSVPQSDAVDGLAEGEPQNVTVALPAGMSVSPSAANGLTACTPAEIGLDDAAQPTCPSSSQIGTVQVNTPLLPDPLTGAVYVAQQDNNPFGSLLAVYVTAEADGALIKLAGQVTADPTTGQLTATFDNNPQLPFSSFDLDFFTGPGAVFATPEQCGTYTTTTTMTAWSQTAPVSSTSSFPINTGCQSGFAPSFTAGTANPQAGKFSPFSLTFSRSSTDQEVSGLSVTLPPGMLAKLAGVQECPEADISSGACPAASQVGTVNVGSGPGTAPYFLPGQVYLTGPYNGGPYGLAVVVPAIAGPFNLGTVVVRQSIRVNPETAQVSVVSDPFPTILQGIPIRIASVAVTLNRSKFTINPTSCDAMAVTGTLTSVQGAVDPVSSRFQVGGCRALSFAPGLRIALTGKGKTRSGDHPKLTAVVTSHIGAANLSDAAVTLPLSLALDPNNSQHVCSYDVAKAVHGGAVHCPAKTVIGSATADTPLLGSPLHAKVYLVQGIRYAHHQRIRTLPTLLVPLRGAIALDLRAKTSVNGREQLVTTFQNIPDASISKFTLNINGGKRGILVITGSGKSICTAPQVATATLDAHSGQIHQESDTLTTPCASKH